MDPPEGLQALDRPATGLPPTPPTMTNSDVSESKPERNRKLSPVPLFADRVRNALESHRSGLSTPNHESHSPPTPDPSPPGIRQTLLPPRPPLSHSPSSFADSFKTAHEGLSASSNVSRDQSPFEDEPSQQQKSWLHATMPVRLDGLGLLGHEPIIANDTSSEEHVRVKNYQMSSPEQNYESDKSEVRAKDYVFSGSEKNDDSDRAEPRVKNYQMESDSDIDQRSRDKVPSPLFRKALNQHMAQHRLRKPIQPGDDVKRPNEALLYSSLGSWKGRKSLDRPMTPPRREKDTTFLRNADLVPPQTPESLIDLETHDEEHETPRQLQKSKEKPNRTPKKLREFAPSESPAMLSPPNTATKERSLEENNNVYRMIQEENAKRHSAISDGSVQAKVVAVPESTKKLRHSKKRESLRGDVSLASNSKRSSSESEHRLKHKRAMDSLGGSEATPEVTPERNTGSIKVSSRISRFDSGQNGFDHWSAPPDEERVRSMNVEPMMAGPVKEPVFRPHRLRRSLRAASLDKQVSIATESDQRPWSMDGLSLAHGQPHSFSPKLRRSSADRRLDRNDDVRRNSIGREPQTMSQKLDWAAHDLTREGHEISDQSSLHDRRRSSEKPGASPWRKGFDPHSLRPIGTPLSTSQFSDRTGFTDAEIGEARGVQFFPHNNDSLLLIHETSVPENAFDTFRNEGLDENDEEMEPSTPIPTFQAVVDAPDDAAEPIFKPLHTVDSPLTNPRAAPEPPVIKFIPPTPNEELERSLGNEEMNNDGMEVEPRPTMPRRLSLSQRMRRYSETVFQPLPFGRMGSLRRSQVRRSTVSEPRPTHLSSFWQPRDFWEEYDSDQDYDPEELEGLPAGGDTSNVEVGRKRSLFPRNMSVRMPGFRGTGGFLLGNSLGLDRHGTNKRRHYIDKRTSEEMLRRLAEQRRRRTFTLPFSGGTQIEYVGLDGLGARMRETRKRRQERALEKRREKLRGQIGTRLYHDGGRCGVTT